MFETINGEDVVTALAKRREHLQAKLEDKHRHEDDRQEQANRLLELSQFELILKRLEDSRDGPNAKPVTYFFLTVEKDRVVIQYEEFGGPQVHGLKDYWHWREFITERKMEAARQGLEITVMASSSMDFPQDSTDNKTVIALARSIRGNEVTV